VRIQVTCDVTLCCLASRFQSYEGSDFSTFSHYLALNLTRQLLLAERNCFTSHRVEMATTSLSQSQISERNVLSLTVREVQDLRYLALLPKMGRFYQSLMTNRGFGGMIIG